LASLVWVLDEVTGCEYQVSLAGSFAGTAVSSAADLKMDPVPRLSWQAKHMLLSEERSVSAGPADECVRWHWTHAAVVRAYEACGDTNWAVGSARPLSFSVPDCSPFGCSP